MKLDTNGKAITYNACFTSGSIFLGQSQTQIASQGTPGQFSFILNKAPDKLKTGQVYKALSFTSRDTDSYVTFTYAPHGGYGYSSSMYNPVGSVTLTEVTPTSIKGTFSTEVFQDIYGKDLVYTITNGVFTTGASAYTTAIGLKPRPKK